MHYDLISDFDYQLITKTNTMKKQAKTITPHHVFNKIYKGALKLELYLDILQKEGLKACPVIYINNQGEAIREIPWLIAVQKFNPNAEVDVHLHNPGKDLEVDEVIRHANIIGTKTTYMLWQEITALELIYQKRQGQKTNDPETRDEKIANALDISTSKLDRIRKIAAVAPNLLKKIDEAQKKGADEKLSLSKQAEICRKIEKLTETICDEQAKAAWVHAIQNSLNKPEQFTSLLAKANRDQKAGVPPMQTVNELLNADFEFPEKTSDEELPETEVDDQEITSVVFTIGSEQRDARSLYMELFPFETALRHEKRFMLLISKIWNEGSSYREAA